MSNNIQIYNPIDQSQQVPIDVPSSELHAPADRLNLMFGFMLTGPVLVSIMAAFAGDYRLVAIACLISAWQTTIGLFMLPKVSK